MAAWIDKKASLEFEVGRRYGLSVEIAGSGTFQVVGTCAHISTTARRQIVGFRFKRWGDGRDRKRESAIMRYIMKQRR